MYCIVPYFTLISLPSSKIIAKVGGNDINNCDFRCVKEGSEVSSLAKGDSQPNPSLPLISPLFMIRVDTHKAVNTEDFSEDVFNSYLES